MEFRQGDVGLKKINNLPEGSVEVKTEGKVILAYGEATGHHHRIEEKGVKLFEKEGERFIEVSSPSNLRHEEHDPIELPAGTYKIIHQREYFPQEIRRVVD